MQAHSFICLWGCKNDVTSVFFKLILRIDVLNIYEIVLGWIPLNPIDGTSQH